MKALILSGGGARGAYQAGVINAIGDIAAKHNVTDPFKIYTGISAGAINASYMAAGAHEFTLNSSRLCQLWSNLSSDKVFKTDAVSLGKIGLQWVGGLSFGGMTQNNQAKSLLDTSPLHELLKNNMDFSRIQKNIDAGKLQALALTALDYRSSEAITFVQGAPNCSSWKRSRRHSEMTTIKSEHIMASSAIPILFPPIQIGDRYFGDGCVRNFVPLSPALHLQADQVLVIGVRQHQVKNYEQRSAEHSQNPSLARMINVLLNSVLLDGVDVDVERLERINEFIKNVPADHREKVNFKPVQSLFIHPTQDIGQIAVEMSSRLPRVIRYLLKGLGPLEEAAETISYLLFEPPFLQKLIEIGYQDGIARQDEIIKFLTESPPQ